MAESTSTEKLLSKIRTQQQASWRDGLRTPIEAYLEANPEAGANRELLLDLVYSEIVLRRQGGEEVAPDDYFRRFPGLADDLRREFEFDGFLDDILPPSKQGSSLADGEKLPLRHLPLEPLPDIEGYDVLSWIESGSFGDVYRARDQSLNRIVALKVLKRTGRVEEANFQREAELVAGLTNPGCFVQVYRFGESQGQQYFAMELMEGGSLKDLALRRSLAPGEIAALMEQVARALQAAHDRGVLHRDLKPGNILLTRDGAPRIADFGLAKKLDEESTITPDGGGALGTVAYMAPEQARGGRGQVGPAADLYGLGGLLYFLLCGRPPLDFDPHEPSQIALHRIQHDTPAPPRRPVAKGTRPPRRSRQEHDLETICLKCLEKNPADRYASAGEVAELLKKIHQGEKIPRSPVALARGFVNTLRQRPGRMFAAAVLALAVLGAAALAVLPGRQLPAEAELRTKERARIADELRTKGRYVFDPKDELPGPFAWRLGEERPFAKTGSVSFDTHELNLLELVDSPGAKHWRLSAKVRHRISSGIHSSVGFYFSLVPLSEQGQPRADSFFRFGFYDRGVGTVVAEAPLERKGRVFFTSRILRENFPLRQERDLSVSLQLKAVMGFDPSPLRYLILEVSPDGVRGYYEDQGVRLLVAPPLAPRELTKPIPYFNQKPIAPVFTPLASIGLFVEKGCADFDQITLERLDP